MQRVLSVTGALAVSIALAAGAVPVAAQAAPVMQTPALEAPAKPPVPTAVRITGATVKTPLVVRAANEPGVFQSLLLQVNWLSTAPPQTTAPKADKLGPKFTVVVLVKDAPQHTYDVYPLAAGGPRAYRPAKQPSGKKTAGWFYGRLTMSETMRLAGIPLPEKPDVVSGGIGGGELVESAAEKTPGPELGDFLTELRHLVLLNGAVVLLIALGLGGISYLVRRRV
jgi:hypothetical protein